MTDNLAGTYVEDTPRPDKVVREIHAWIGTHPEGGEGVLSADMPFGPGGERRHMPLFASERRVALMLQPVAEACCQAARDDAGLVVTCKLVTFRRVADA